MKGLKRPMASHLAKTTARATIAQATPYATGRSSSALKSPIYPIRPKVAAITVVVTIMNPAGGRVTRNASMTARTSRALFVGS